ncbi:MAG TPA: acetylornithine deacetylase, partial [Rhizobiales bacterium]|nr:acetylornithine deacetylase [Hyphomicrobiales bacterium]
MSQSIEILSKLVSFDTVSRNSNLDLVDWVVAYLADLGVECQTFKSPCGTKANMLATIGPDVPGGVVLSGHTDVVPVDDQIWATDPFELTQKGTRLYGRGSCDMKGFDAICLAKVPEMLKANLKTPIHLAFSYDEEVGLLGAIELAPRLAEILPDVKAILVGEPTEMKVVEQHKGFMYLKAVFEGIEAHSSMPYLGVSSNVAATKFMSALVAMDEEFAASKDNNSPFLPPHSTINIAVISGGTAGNIIPNKSVVDVSIRVMPEEDVNAIVGRITAEMDSIRSWMQDQDPACNAILDLDADTYGLRKEPDGQAATLCRRYSGDNSDNVVSYGTDGGVFQKAGFSVAICGPGSIDQAHKPDEFIEISQIEA